MARGVRFLLGFRQYPFLKKNGPGIPGTAFCQWTSQGLRMDLPTGLREITSHYILSWCHHQEENRKSRSAVRNVPEKLERGPRFWPGPFLARFGSKLGSGLGLGLGFGLGIGSGLSAFQVLPTSHQLSCFVSGCVFL